MADEYIALSHELDRMLEDPAGVSIQLFRCRDSGWRVRIDSSTERLYLRAYPALVQMAGHVLKTVIGDKQRRRYVGLS